MNCILFTYKHAYQNLIFYRLLLGILQLFRSFFEQDVVDLENILVKPFANNMYRTDT